jgi:hypothetical protein
MRVFWFEGAFAGLGQVRNVHFDRKHSFFGSFKFFDTVYRIFFGRFFFVHLGSGSNDFKSFAVP